MKKLIFLLLILIVFTNICYPKGISNKYTLGIAYTNNYDFNSSNNYYGINIDNWRESINIGKQGLSYSSLKVLFAKNNLANLGLTRSIVLLPKPKYYFIIFNMESKFDFSSSQTHFSMTPRLGILVGNYHQRNHFIFAITYGYEGLIKESIYLPKGYSSLNFSISINTDWFTRYKDIKERKYKDSEL